ncbi:hypothetical protein ACFS5L_10145 [Streptomyces phyllanthi]|uniref:hypothetical protein n=1 Tax=Streptomyces phyllanthi TaxID=1803180 RepID=UPI001D14EE92|nr:hypothetical protein [Streptomyces phyllanthi]
MAFSLATLGIDGTPTPALCVDDRYWALADVAPDTTTECRPTTHLPRAETGPAHVDEGGAV